MSSRAERKDRRRTISYQAMAQPQAQDVTVTFADGTSMTMRYVGSGVRRINEDPDGPYQYVSLNFVAAMDAVINPPATPGEERQ